MGQKVNPIGFRTGITRDWQSRWYAKKRDFGNLLVEDQRIREYIKKNYKYVGIPRIEIERSREKVTVYVYAARPALIVGRRGARVEKFASDLEELTGKSVDLKIMEVRKPELSAQLVAESIAEQIEKRAHIRRTMKKAADMAMESGALGVKVIVSGRLAGAEIARSETLTVGKLPLQTLQADVDYGFATAVITMGSIGVKVWIYRGDVADKEKEVVSDGVDAKKGKAPKGAKGSNKGSSDERQPREVR